MWAGQKLTYLFQGMSNNSRWSSTSRRFLSSVCELLPRNASPSAVMIETKDCTSSATSVTFPASVSCFTTPASTSFSLILHPALSMKWLSPLSQASSYGQQRQAVQCHVGLLLTAIHTFRLQQTNELSILCNFRKVPGFRPYGCWGLYFRAFLYRHLVSWGLKVTLKSAIMIRHILSFLCICSPADKWG